MGFWQAGFRPIGLDIKKQKRYPFEFIQLDLTDENAPRVLRDLVRQHRPALITASPPCPTYSVTKHGATHAHNPHQNERLILATRYLHKRSASGIPLLIENVEGAKSELDPHKTVRLCGSSHPFACASGGTACSSSPLPASKRRRVTMTGNSCTGLTNIKTARRRARSRCSGTRARAFSTPALLVNSTSRSSTCSAVLWESTG